MHVYLEEPYRLKWEKRFGLLRSRSSERCRVVAAVGTDGMYACTCGLRRRGGGAWAASVSVR